jgi:hypothetical protein
VAQGLAEDLQADDGKHYGSFDDFVSRFDPDSFDDVEEHSAGMQIRGYINGRNVMSWEFDDESKTSGYGNYDMTMLEAEQIDEIGDTPAGQAALRSYADKARSQGRWAAGVALHPMGKLVEPNADAIADKRFAGAKKADAKAAAKGPTLPEMSEADSLQARTGINSVNKKPRAGQTDYSEIPAGNHPRSRNRYSDEYRSSQPERLKHSIKASLGKHAEPNLPESMASMLNRLDELAESTKKQNKGNDGNLANNAKPYDKVTRGDVIAGRLGKDEMGGKEQSLKELDLNLLKGAQGAMRNANPDTESERNRHKKYGYRSDRDDTGNDNDYDEYGNLKNKKKSAASSDGPKKKGRPAKEKQPERENRRGKK